MLFKIAWSNVRRAGRDYLVYFVTLSLAVMVFYAFNTISLQADFLSGDTRSLVQLLGSMLTGLTVFLAVIMGFLMVYANNFIMKRRKKEFGLYQILGMSRGQVSRVMTFETTIVSVGALVLGLVLGVGLSWLMVFFTGVLFKTQIADFHFFISPVAIFMTVGCLVCVFLLSLVFNLRVVRKSKVIDLIGASRKNESVKTRNTLLSAVVFVAGVVLVGVSYARLLHDGLPYSGEASETQAFLITTAMVCVGTIMLFFGLSGFLLKVLQSMKGVYYRNLNMFTLRQLSAKVNTVSASMAVISMILFLAITSVTTGMSIATTMSNNLEQHTPFSWSINLMYHSPSMVESLSASGEEGFAAADEPLDVRALLEEGATDESGNPVGLDFSRVSDDVQQFNYYDSWIPDEGTYAVTLQQLCDLAGVELPNGMESGDGDPLGLQVMKESDYNRLMDYLGYDRIDLGEDGYVITSDMGETVTDIYDAVLSKGCTLEIGGRTLSPRVDRIDPDLGVMANSNMGSNAGTIVLPDSLVEECGFPVYTSVLALNYKDGVSTEEGDEYVRQEYSYPDALDGAGNSVGSFGLATTRTEMYASADSMTGIISYLAIYIGFVLVVACAAILTIQQISGVSDAGGNYRILSELGTPTRSINRSVLLQQSIFFAFPLVVGIAHSAVALKVVIELVAMFGGFSIGSTVALTCAVFAVAYGGYFAVTYLMSKGIVHDAIRVRYAA